MDIAQIDAMEMEQDHYIIQAIMDLHIEVIQEVSTCERLIFLFFKNFMRVCKFFFY